MPPKSAKQRRFMEGVAHGMKPRGGKGPTKAQAREFLGEPKQRAAPKRSKGHGVISKRAANNKRLGYKADRVAVDPFPVRDK